MASGDGRYASEATAVFLATEAAALILIVLGGRNGNGFEVQFSPSAANIQGELPRILRELADSIEQSPPAEP